MPVSDRTSHKTRREIAHLAARLLAVDGANSFQAAKKKAALQLGVRADRFMPTNVEIEQALQEYQRLFQGESRDANLRRLRETALEAMTLLDRFRPRLVGPVLNGTATEHSEVTLHLTSDDPDQVGVFLLDQGIPCTSIERTIKTTANEFMNIPGFRFIAGRTTIILVVFTTIQRNLNPLSQIDDRPMRRASASEVTRLLDHG